MATLRKRGDTWHVIWREHGRQRGKAVGSKRKAEELRKEIEFKLLRGEMVGEDKEKRVSFTTFCEPFFGNQALQGITPKDIERYKASRRREAKPATVNRELCALKCMLNRAVDWGYLKASPGAQVKRYKLPKQKYRWLSSAEGRRLIDVAEGQMKAFVAVGINTGLRKGEIFRLEWEDIDLEREELTVREAKGGEFRVIPMNEELVQILRKHPRHITSPYVFHRSNGEPWQDARKSYWETLNRAKLPTTFRFHDMRHTFISNLVAQGEDLRSVQELAGHKDIRTTMQYAHLAPGRLKEAVSRLKWEAG